MAKFVCTVCGYTAENEAPEACPVCKAAKSAFKALDENNKKSFKKVIPVLDDVYINGDRTAQNVVVGIVLCGAVKDNKERYDIMLEALSEYQFLKVAFFNIMNRYKTDKAFRALFN